MKPHLLATIALGALCIAGPNARAADAPKPATAADAQFKALYTREWTWREAEFGRIDDDEGEGKHNDHLPHVDAASQARRLSYWDDVLKSLAAIDPNTLSPEEKINYLVYKDQIFDLAAEQRFKTYEAPFNSDSQFWADLAPSAGAKLAHAAEYRAYLGRLHDLPRFFDEETDNMRAGLKRRLHRCPAPASWAATSPSPTWPPRPIPRPTSSTPRSRPCPPPSPPMSRPACGPRPPSWCERAWCPPT